MRRSGIVLVCLVPLLALALACQPQQRQSGTSLGSFHVEGALEDNQCRPGFEPIDPLAFSVQLRRDGATLVWRVGDGPPAGGPLRDDGTFRIVARTTIEAWPADPANGIVGCSIQRIETITGTLVMESAGDAGVPGGDAGSDAGAAQAASFTADHEIEIAPGGGDCSALLLVNGGSFPMLPCDAVYRLEGEREAE